MLAYNTKPVPHFEARKILSNKPAVTRDVFDQLPEEIQADAFTITGIEDFDVLQGIRDRIADLPAGANWDEVKKDIARDMSPWLSEKSAARRAEVLMQHHGYSAYDSTEKRALDEMRDVFPYYQYLTDKGPNVRATHAALHGIILPSDHPFWDTHWGSWEWGCHCRQVPMTDEDAAEEGRLDKKRPAHQQRILKPEEMTALEKGQLVRGGQRADVRTQRQINKDQGKPGGYENNRTHHGIDYSQIRHRWDSDTRDEFEQWADRQELGPGTLLDSLLKRGTFKENSPGDQDPAGAVPAFTTLLDTLLKGGAVSYGTPGSTAAMSLGQRAAITAREEDIRSLGKEHGSLYNTSGEEQWRGQGAAESISIPHGTAAAGHIFTHNHPAGTSFSPEDIAGLYSHRLSELRAVTRAGSYSASRVPGVPLSRIHARLAQISPDIAATLRKMEASHSPAELDRIQNHLAWSALADEGLIHYHYTPMKPDKPIQDALSAKQETKETVETAQPWDGRSFISHSAEARAAFRRGEAEFPGLGNLAAHLTTEGKPLVYLEE